MDEIEISYLEMHNILKEMRRQKNIKKNNILAKSILNKFGFIYDKNMEKAVEKKLRKSFSNNYFHKWKISHCRLVHFEAKEKDWLENIYKPFKDLDFQCEDEGLY